jgi:hypothetical protein
MFCGGYSKYARSACPGYSWHVFGRLKVDKAMRRYLDYLALDWAHDRSRIYELPVDARVEK